MEKRTKQEQKTRKKGGDEKEEEDDDDDNDDDEENDDDEDEKKEKKGREIRERERIREFQKPKKSIDRSCRLRSAPAIVRLVFQSTTSERPTPFLRMYT